MAMNEEEIDQSINLLHPSSMTGLTERANNEWVVIVPD
jgi:hypothetical protein